MLLDIVYSENTLTADDFQKIRASTGRAPISLTQIESALKAGLYNVVATYDGQAIGMGRLVGDGSMYWYIQDLFINPAYQGRGIGKTIMDYMTAHIEGNTAPGTTTMVGLFSAKGKDGFYEKLGYAARPSEKYGAGMIRHLTITESEVEK